MQSRKPVPRFAQHANRCVHIKLSTSAGAGRGQGQQGFRCNGACT